MLSVEQAAQRMGVSRRTVYDLAAPAGPIPATRIGRRVLFSEVDIQEYLASCRHTEIKREVATFLNSTARLKASESALQSYFQERGRKPKLTPDRKSTRLNSSH